MPRRVRIALLGCLLLAGCAGPGAGAPIESAVGSAALLPTSLETPRGAPTAEPTPSTLPTPAALTTPTPVPGTLALEALSCDGGVALEWSPSADAAFHHYTALRSENREIPPVYPPIAPAVDWGGTYATDRFVVSAVDATFEPSQPDWNYRVMSYDVDGRVIEVSSVVTAQLLPVAALGPASAQAAGGRRTRLEWDTYSGPSACFTEYRILHGAGDPPTTLLATVSDRRETTLVTDALRAGTTYVLRVEAIKTTALGSFVVARSELVTYTP
ncbi:MAG: hypothetical protein ACXWWO_02570 [Candidatus Limnocylindria bacterium]